MKVPLPDLSGLTLSTLSVPSRWPAALGFVERKWWSAGGAGGVGGSRGLFECWLASFSKKNNVAGDKKLIVLFPVESWQRV